MNKNIENEKSSSKGTIWKIGILEFLKGELRQSANLVVYDFS